MITGGETLWTVTPSCIEAVAGLALLSVVSAVVTCASSAVDGGAIVATTLIDALGSTCCAVKMPCWDILDSRSCDGAVCSSTVRVMSS